MQRAFLYIDILGFENLVKTNPSKVDKIFSIFDSLNVHKHEALQTVVFSDTILVFNKDESWSVDYYCTYLVEYTQELFYNLSLINVYFKAILTFGEFKFSQLNNIQAYYGLTLIDAFKDEKKLKGFGLFVNKNISDEVIIFDKIELTEKYEFVLLCKSLIDLYSTTNGRLPINTDILYETDTAHRIDEDLRFLREIEFLKNNHPDSKVKRKYRKVYSLYKKALPRYFKIFESKGFRPTSLNENYFGKINPDELLAKEELGI